MRHRISIAESCKLKAWYVVEDETEQGVRAHLNYGHTFGHALERETNYARFLHGEAVGIGMRSHSGVAATMFKALGDAGINIGMISTSEIKIAVTVDEPRIEDAARAVHDAFGLDKVPA